MTCVVCNHDRIDQGETTVTLERGELTLVVKGVPARVCPNCGESYVEDSVATDLLRTAEHVAQSGARFDLRQYTPLARPA